MSKLKYEHLIYYTICESLFDAMKQTNFSTLSSMCKTINQNISNGLMLSTEEYKVITKTMNEVSLLYGLEDYEMIEPIKNFFSLRMWETYGEIVYIYKTHLKECYFYKE